MKYRAIVIGCSAGGMQAIAEILEQLPDDFRLPIIVAQHLHKEQGDYLIQFYSKHTQLKVQEAKEKEKIMPKHIYVAPPDYHLLIERDETFSLSVDKKVNYSRPSIDVLFESAADTYGAALAGVILTGANNDGAYGLKKIKDHGGLTLVQHPENAKFNEMPQSALHRTEVDHVLNLGGLGRFLGTL